MRLIVIKNDSTGINANQIIKQKETIMLSKQKKMTVGLLFQF